MKQKLSIQLERYKDINGYSIRHIAGMCEVDRGVISNIINKRNYTIDNVELVFSKLGLKLPK